MQGAPPTPGFDPASLPLKEYHLPDPVSWWPPAIGWWLVVLLLCCMVAACMLLWKRHQKKQWRRDAVMLLNEITNQFQETQDGHQLSQEISIFLRRVCRTRFPKDDGTHLTGENWLTFLDACMKPGKQKVQLFQTSTGVSLLEAAYNPTSTVDSLEVITTVQQWLKNLPEKPWRSND